MTRGAHNKSLTLLIFLSAISALNAISIDMGLPSLKAMEASFKIAPGSGIMTLSYYMLGFAITPFFSGPLSDRFGRKPVLIGGLISFAATSLGCALGVTFDMVLAFRALQGVAAGFCVVMPMAVIRDLFEGDLARSYQGQVNAILSLAPLVGPSLGNIVDQHMGWRYVYALQGIAALLILIYCLCKFNESLPAGERQSIAPKEIIKNYAALLSHPRFLSSCLNYVAFFGALLAYISGSALVFMQKFGLSGTVYSFVFFGTAISMMLGSMISSRLSARGIKVFPQLRACAITVFIASAVCLAASLFGFSSALLVAVVACLINLSFGVSIPNTIHEALCAVPRIAGSASGLMRSLQMFAGSATAAMVTALSDSQPDKSDFALGLTMFACSIVAVIAFLWWAFYTKKQQSLAPGEKK